MRTISQNVEKTGIKCLTYANGIPSCTHKIFVFLPLCAIQSNQNSTLLECLQIKLIVLEVKIVKGNYLKMSNHHPFFLHLNHKILSNP